MYSNSIWLGILFFGIFLSAILLLLRLHKKMSPAILVCVAAIMVYGIALIGFATFHQQLYFFAFSASYWFFTLSLLMVFGAVYKSISLRMMLGLFNKSGKSDNYNDILKQYIKDESYHNRVDILLEKGWAIKNREGNLQLTEKGRLLAISLAIAQGFFAIRNSG